MEPIISAHVTHKTATMTQLEKIGDQNVLFLLHSVSNIEGIRECAVLKTCNRVEIYAVTDKMEESRKGLEDLINGFIPFDSQENLVQYLSGKGSVKHLLRVASGLESMVIGEDQIQSQVKEAFETAENEGLIGPVLSIVFRKAISVGKKVRTETRVNKGGVSVGSVAVELAESKVGTIEGKNILVIGAGEMATLIAKHLAGKNPKAVFVSNRTYSRAVELAWALNGRAVRFDSLIEFLSEADVVLCATSATHMILTKRSLQLAMDGRPSDRKIIVIDVSFPRNVEREVDEVQGVELYDIDGLRGLAEENVLKRKAEISNAEAIIATELNALEDRICEMRADEVLRGIYRKFNDIKEKEVTKAINRAKANNADISEVINDFANSLTNRFLADPTTMLKTALKDGDEEVLTLMKDLFKLEGEIYVPRKPAEKIA